MWLYLAALVGLYHLVCWYRERQVVSDLQDKYVLITGCGSGFGNLLARQLDMRGLRVLAACRTEKSAEQLRKQTSGRLQTVILDVTRTESIAAATEWVKERVGDRGLWGLVNNAGVHPGMGLSEWQKTEEFMNVFKVNLFGLTEVTLSMLPLVRRARGRIVNVSSIAGRIALGPPSYSCSKFGVEAFSDVLRRELKDFGVKVSVIDPSGFRTGMTNMQRNLEKMKKIWDDAPIHIKEAYGQHYFTAYFNIIKKSLLVCNTNLFLVTDKMEHALTSVHPRTRYFQNWLEKWLFTSLFYFPTSLVDYIMNKRFPKPTQAA